MTHAVIFFLPQAPAAHTHMQLHTFSVVNSEFQMCMAGLNVYSYIASPGLYR